MHPAARVKNLALAVAGLMILSACVVVEEPGPGPRPEPGPGYCSRDYRPVCARRGEERRTFANACLADRAGYRILGAGECHEGSQPDQRVCTREYRPVCARRHGNLRTFGNACEADAAGWRVVSDGEC